MNFLIQKEMKKNSQMEEWVFGLTVEPPINQVTNRAEKFGHINGVAALMRFFE